MKEVVIALLTTYKNELDEIAGSDRDYLYIETVQRRINNILEYIIDMPEKRDEPNELELLEILGPAELLDVMARRVKNGLNVI